MKIKTINNEHLILIFFSGYLPYVKNSPLLLFQLGPKHFARTANRKHRKQEKFCLKMPSSMSSPPSPPPASVPGHVTAQIDDSRIVTQFLKVLS